MFDQITDDIKRTFQSGNMVSKLILVNIFVFLFVLILGIFLKGTDPNAPAYKWLIKNLAISADGSTLLWKPWTLVSHMFLHEGFWHIIWNMLLLYWFGRIVGDFIGDDRILPLYIMGGLVGGVCYYISAKLGIISTNSVAMGASAAVMAIIACSAFLSPNYNMRLLLAFGGFFVYLLRNGTDLAQTFNYFFEAVGEIFTKKETSKSAKKSPLVVKHRSNKMGSKAKGNKVSDSSLPYQEKLDKILEKIKEQGYDKLSDEEKEFLFQASKK